ncbi:hypothetical protein [Kamptonema formosum]|uniref:hypothetical protein n=1 Tax=Kamptonema formosum TaxID=331992 RepID=UPI0003692B01|nr:hypothetical protein [Oscillatoria sp. PCC 10802]
MFEKSRKSRNSLEIANLIDSAVSNAAARRAKVVDSGDPLTALSDEEANAISGGATSISPIVQPPIIMGIIAVDKEVSNLSSIS